MWLQGGFECSEYHVSEARDIHEHATEPRPQVEAMTKPALQLLFPLSTQRDDSPHCRLSPSLPKMCTPRFSILVGFSGKCIFHFANTPPPQLWRLRAILGRLNPCFKTSTPAAECPQGEGRASTKLADGFEGIECKQLRLNPAPIPRQRRKTSKRAGQRAQCFYS